MKSTSVCRIYFYRFAADSRGLVRGLILQPRKRLRFSTMLFSKLALVGRVQVEEFAAFVGHAADLRTAQFIASLAAGIVIVVCLPPELAKKARACSPARLGLNT